MILVVVSMRHALAPQHLAGDTPEGDAPVHAPEGDQRRVGDPEELPDDVEQDFGDQMIGNVIKNQLFTRMY